MPARQLDQELIDHACSQLYKVARRHVNNGEGPASAARKAIRETQALFPTDWRLAIQGDDDDEHVEVWEVDHKRAYPCARVSRDVDLPPRSKPLPTKKTKTAKSTKRKRRAYEIAQAIAGQASDTGSAFYDFLLERFPSGDVPWPWVEKILKGHGVPMPLMIGLGKEDAEQYGIRQGKPADVHQLAKFLGY